MTTETTKRKNPWKETLRDMYDDLHFGKDNTFTGSRLAKRLVAFIEERHPRYFNTRPWRKNVKPKN
jgi:hypothetical protein